MNQVGTRLELRKVVPHRITKFYRKLYGNARFEGLKIIGFLIIENEVYQAVGGRMSKRYNCLRYSVCEENSIDYLSTCFLSDPALMALNSVKDFLYLVGREIEEAEEEEEEV